VTDARTERFASGVVFGVGVLVGVVAMALVLWGLLGAAGAATSAYDDACSTQEITTEYENGEVVVHVEDRDPAWFCITTTESDLT